MTYFFSESNQLIQTSTDISLKSFVRCLFQSLVAFFCDGAMESEGVKELNQLHLKDGIPFGSSASCKSVYD